MSNLSRLSFDNRDRAHRAGFTAGRWGGIDAKCRPARRMIGAALALMIIATSAASSVDGAPQSEEQTWVIGDYVAHANAMRTDFLAPQVADKLNIERSNEKALVTVSVHRPGRPVATSSVEADVRVTATRSADAVESIEMREHRGDDSIYYLGVLPIRDREPVSFDFAVAPAPGDQTYRFGFERYFFTD